MRAGRKSNDSVAFWLLSRLGLLGVSLLLWLHALWVFNLTNEFSIRVLVLVGLVYLCLAIAFCNVFDCFDFEKARVRDLVAWYALAMLFSIACSWPLVMLACSRIVTVLPFILTWLAQTLLAVPTIIICKRITYKIKPPKKICAIISGYDYEQRMISKLNRYPERFEIVSVINQRLVSIAELEDLAPECDTLLLGDIRPRLHNALVNLCFKNNCSVLDIPSVESILTSSRQPMQVADGFLLSISNGGLTKIQRFSKRAVDIIGGVIGIIISAIPIGICAIAIKCEDGGPVFYRQDRLTENGRVFKLIKLRSMREDAEKDGIMFSSEGDKRVTKVGRFIRKMRLDETPQFINVLKGDLSLCGPRSERPEIAARQEEKHPEFNYRLKVKAGLTGYAQVHGQYNTVLGDKLRMDLYYIEHWSLLLDFVLMLQTIKIIISPDATQGYEEGSIEYVLSHA